MTTLHYYMIDPTKNITALVGTPVPPASRPFAARGIMENEPACEQVGFVWLDETGAPRLAMAGGEFCGNAAMSAAALSCQQTGLRPGNTRTVRLTVSGAAEPVPVRVTAEEDGYFSCTVRMPPPERIETVSLPLDGKIVSLPVVFLPGIAHIMVTKDELDAGTAERVIRDWCGRLSAAGLGIMLFDKNRNTLRPLVYIPGSDTLFWESSCASGTAALGAYLAGSSEPVSLAVAEPGGALRVYAEKGSVDLSGRVAILDKRQIIVDL